MRKLTYIILAVLWLAASICHGATSGPIRVLVMPSDGAPFPGFTTSTVMILDGWKKGDIRLGLANSSYWIDVNEDGTYSLTDDVALTSAGLYVMGASYGWAGVALAELADGSTTLTNISKIQFLFEGDWSSSAGVEAGSTSQGIVRLTLGLTTPSLSGLTDVGTSTPADQDLLVFDNPTSSWYPGRVPIGNLSDVASTASTPAPASQSVLEYISGQWTPTTKPAIGLVLNPQFCPADPIEVGMESAYDDEFNSTSLDTSKWTIDNGEQGTISFLTGTHPTTNTWSLSFWDDYFTVSMAAKPSAIDDALILYQNVNLTSGQIMVAANTWFGWDAWNIGGIDMLHGLRLWYTDGGTSKAVMISATSRDAATGGYDPAYFWEVWDDAASSVGTVQRRWAVAGGGQTGAGWVFRQQQKVYFRVWFDDSTTTWAGSLDGCSWVEMDDIAVTGPIQRIDLVSGSKEAGEVPVFVGWDWIRVWPGDHNWIPSTIVPWRSYVANWIATELDMAMLEDYTRRDGTNQPTGNWDFVGYNLSNVGNLSTTGSATFQKRNASSPVYIDSYDLGSGYPALYTRKSYSDTMGTLAETADGQTLGFWGAQGVDATLLSPVRQYGAQIRIYQDGSAGVGYVPAEMHLITRDGNGYSSTVFQSDGDIQMQAGRGIACPDGTTTGSLVYVISCGADLVDGRSSVTSQADYYVYMENSDYAVYSMSMVPHRLNGKKVVVDRITFYGVVDCDIDYIRVYSGASTYVGREADITSGTSVQILSADLPLQDIEQYRIKTAMKADAGTTTFYRFVVECHTED